MSRDFRKVSEGFKGSRQHFRDFPEVPVLPTFMDIQAGSWSVRGFRGVSRKFKGVSINLLTYKGSKGFREHFNGESS